MHKHLEAGRQVIRSKGCLWYLDLEDDAYIIDKFCHRPWISYSRTNPPGDWSIIVDNSPKCISTEGWFRLEKVQLRLVK